MAASVMLVSPNTHFAGLQRWSALSPTHFFTQTRQTFAHADQVTVKSKRTTTVFNITNDFRLVTAIHYNREEVYTMRFLTHADYDKNKWKDTL
jgi:mRNA-degrading endonuclease HigB of HigAB toxin-antitoxin module